ncbi:MAG: hypothetical protein IT436_13560 [Phycisphaerales bacterium]|nr:hypothetical protein [Phycisphaerales bacterium]
MPARPDNCRHPESMTEHQRLAEVADLLALAFERSRAIRGDAREGPGTLGDAGSGLEQPAQSRPDRTAG